ncbi:MAG: hypothetical protein IKJ45_06150 [Kiritimatiellae bacterium]|nr:hypothetical protein [Kiritimatiellia bacterium]
MKTIKMPVLDRNAKTITATREFLIRAGQFGSTEFNILLDMQKTNPGFKVAEQKCKRNSDKNVHAALTYDKMVDFIKGYYKDEAELKVALNEYIIIKKTSKTMPAAYAYVKKWFLGKYKDEFKAYEDEQKAKKAAASTNNADELNALLKTAN